jgi:hypothetical protein
MRAAHFCPLVLQPMMTSAAGMHMPWRKYTETQILTHSLDKAGLGELVDELYPHPYGWANPDRLPLMARNINTYACAWRFQRASANRKSALVHPDEAAHHTQHINSPASLHSIPVHPPVPLSSPFSALRRDKRLLPDTVQQSANERKTYLVSCMLSFTCHCLHATAR